MQFNAEFYEELDLDPGVAMWLDEQGVGFDTDFFYRFYDAALDILAREERNGEVHDADWRALERDMERARRRPVAAVLAVARGAGLRDGDESDRSWDYSVEE